MFHLCSHIFDLISCLIIKRKAFGCFSPLFLFCYVVQIFSHLFSFRRESRADDQTMLTESHAQIKILQLLAKHGELFLDYDYV